MLGRKRVRLIIIPQLQLKSAFKTPLDGKRRMVGFIRHRWARMIPG
jgi:hypothetical protein